MTISRRCRVTDYHVFAVITLILIPNTSTSVAMVYMKDQSFTCSHVPMVDASGL